MGLDMYLIKRKKDDKRDLWDFDEELIYWRKANAIHKYLCDNGEEIESQIIYKENKEVLKSLLELCKDIISKTYVEYNDEILKYTELSEEIKEKAHQIKAINPKELESMLPTCDGFFFGSLEYDGYYLYDVEKTIEELEKVIPTINEDENIYYLASW